MDDTQTPFDFAFGPQPPPLNPHDGEPRPNGRKKAVRKAKGKRGRPKKVVVAPPVAIKKAPVDVIVRRPRKARAVKVELALVMSALAGITEDDAKFISGVVQGMSAFPASQKRRVVIALNRLFG